ncbi:MAG TPA: biosynthetic peptidoglycan transglycosylase, partial [Chitinophagales bacterium]|nr:biosynthetic peptidoglycan transglycosylase [Chitinophagales bacterium]
LWLPLTVLLLVLLWFASRNTLLHLAFGKFQKQALNQYQLKIEAAEVRFNGVNQITLIGLFIQPLNADTLLKVNNLTTKISLPKLLTGHFPLNFILADSLQINAFNLPERNNISWLNNKRNSTSTNEKNQPRQPAIKNLEAQLIRALNTNFTIQEAYIAYYDTAKNENIYLPRLSNTNGAIAGTIIDNESADTITLTGSVLTRNKSYTFNAVRTGKAGTYLPFLDHNNGLKGSFDSISTKIDFARADNGQLITTQVALHNLIVNNWRLAKTDVVIYDAVIQTTFEIANDNSSIKTQTSLLLNHAAFNISAGIATKPDTIYTLNIDMPEIASDSFFNALPQGIFTTLKGISCTGSLQYNLHFRLNASQADSVVFDAILKRKNFGIRHFGAEDFTRINNPFTYDAYARGQFVRQIEIGPQNPYYTPLSQISHYLPLSVMQAEDPSFFQHRGFIPEALRESIAQDYKEHRFARGGSTLSMQLVKNVFLNQNKTISRKAEEALIVYLIENEQLVSKERMLEVYLNIIEWGPNVYGIGEAAKFYFNKKPSQLSLAESIFLAAIIPNPRSFRYQFDKQGHVKGYISDFSHLLVNRMFMRNLLTPADTTGFTPNIELKGIALQMVVPADSIIPAQDSIPDVD